MKAEMLKALGHPTRLAVVELLGTHGERCVCELVEQVGGGDRTTISKHLAVLKAAGVVSDRKEGLKVFYRLRCGCVVPFLGCIEQMVRQRVQEDQDALAGLSATAPH
jgi:ArsR family transcriptional regulator